jgi:hypothetical protein
VTTRSFSVFFPAVSPAILKMKILCLHGNNTSGAIFAVQSLAFRKLLGDDHEYVFLDGELESDCVIGKFPLIIFHSTYM